MLRGGSRHVRLIEQDPSRFRPNDVPIMVGNSRRLQQATGWRPEISFEKMIDDLLEYWRQSEAKERR